MTRPRGVEGSTRWATHATAGAHRFCRNGHRVAPGSVCCPACGGRAAPEGRLAYTVRWAGSFLAFLALVAVMAVLLAGRGLGAEPPEDTGMGPMSDALAAVSGGVVPR